MTITHEDIIRYLERVSPEEFQEIIAELRRRLGYPPPAPRFITIAGAMPLTGMPLSDDFSVRLLRAGADPKAVILALRSLFEGRLGLGEVKKLVDSAPVVLWDQSLAREEAARIMDALTAAGATVERF
jgi:ribosomal protein L7/L12